MAWRTIFPGVRAKTHPTRKHGKRLDQYFSVRYQRDKKTVVEGLGWASDGWTASKAADILAGLKKSIRTGKGPQSLAEQRAEAKAARDAETRESLTLSSFYNETYLPQATENKTRGTMVRERSLFKQWLAPNLGDLPLSSISVLDLERLKSVMAAKRQSPRSITYALALVRQIYTIAKDVGLYQGDNLVSRVRKPSQDNRRTRFLTHAEADRLLTALLDEGYEDLHDMTLLSLHTGMRAGEVLGLTWDCVDLEQKIIHVRDTKNKRNRVSYMTGQVRDMLTKRQTAGRTGLLFRKSDGKKFGQIPNVFYSIVDKSGLNDGVTDRRDRAVFHTARHSYASWHVQNGTDLYVVKELLGHSSLSQTERYSHLSNGTLQEAVRKLDNSMQAIEVIQDIRAAK